MSYDTIEFTIEAGVARLVLNRPDKLNSLNDEMHEELRQALKTAAKDASVRCVLLTGNGRGFCAGQDLSDRQMMPGDEPPDLRHTLDNNYNPLIRRLRGLDMPVVCAVNGVAAGAGANIALACDIVIAARSAKFIQAFSKIGLIPDSGGTWTLPRLVGHARAVALAMLGEAVSAEQAAAWGMIWKCVDDEALEATTAELCGHFATAPTVGLKYIKRAINSSWGNTLREQLDLERDYQSLASRSEDYREGVAAFLEKRAPQFKGK